MKKIMTFFAAIAILSVSSCTPPATKTVTPEVTVTAGEATETTLSFSVSTSDAFAAAYLCLTENEATPTAEDVLMKGKSIAVNKEVECSVTRLTDNTTYIIYAAAMSETEFALSNPVTMTTTEIPASPTATLSAGEVEGKTFTFTITPAEAEFCAYKLYNQGDEATADDVLETGTEVAIDEPTEVELTDLSKGQYFIVAVAKNGETVSLSEKLEFTITGAESVIFTVDNVKGERYTGEAMLKIYDADLNNLFVDYYHGSSESGLPAGTYTWGYYPTSFDTPDAWKLWSYYTTMKVNDIDYEFTGGTATVVRHDNGTFTLTFDLNRNDGKVVDFTWTGQIEWTR